MTTGMGKAPISMKLHVYREPRYDLMFGKTNYAMDIFNASWHADVNPIEGLTLTARYGLNVNNRKYMICNPYMGQSSSYAEPRIAIEQVFCS